jgi:hypothetical protein
MCPRKKKTAPPATDNSSGMTGKSNPSTGKDEIGQSLYMTPEKNKTSIPTTRKSIPRTRKDPRLLPKSESTSDPSIHKVTGKKKSTSPTKASTDTKTSVEPFSTVASR